MLSEKKILNETKNHNPPLQVKWSVPLNKSAIIQENLADTNGVYVIRSRKLKGRQYNGQFEHTECVPYQVKV